MSRERRTTVVANEDDLAVVADEARARGMALGRLLGEIVAQRATALRKERRPHLGTFEADVSIAAEMDSGDERPPPAFRT